MNEPGLNGTAEPSFSESATLTVGARLAAARQALDMSVADVARQIKLSVPQVEAIEADDLSRLPKSAVIVKGFVRNYARLVQLEPDGLIDPGASAPRSGAAIVGKGRMREVPLHGPTRSWRKPVAIAVLAVAAVLTASGLYLNPELLPAPILAALTPTEPAPPPAPPKPAQPAPADVPLGAPRVQDAPSPGLPSYPRVAESVPATPVPERPRLSATDLSPVAASASGQGIVRLKFERDSWVEIKDRDGNKIFSQINRAGTEQAVQGIPPLQLVIGSAGGVQVIWNNQPVDLAPYSKVDVARFTLE
jgi:cytoskeleton protein RodZ